jgi:phosphate/sulfate permease
MSTSVMGVGAAVHPRGIRWDLVADIALVWLVTIPAAGVVSAAIVITGRLF